MIGCSRSVYLIMGNTVQREPTFGDWGLDQIARRKVREKMLRLFALKFLMIVVFLSSIGYLNFGLISILSLQYFPACSTTSSRGAFRAQLGICKTWLHSILTPMHSLGRFRKISAKWLPWLICGRLLFCAWLDKNWNPSVFGKKSYSSLYYSFPVLLVFVRISCLEQYLQNLAIWTT